MVSGSNHQSLLPHLFFFRIWNHSWKLSRLKWSVWRVLTLHSHTACLFLLVNCLCAPCLTMSKVSRQTNIQLHCYCFLRGKVHPKMKILLSFTHFHDVPNMNDFNFLSLNTKFHAFIFHKIRANCKQELLNTKKNIKVSSHWSMKLLKPYNHNLYI